MSEATELEFTGERLTTSYTGDTAIEHLHRYAFATAYVQDKVVLDIASGEGYGSNILARYAASVVGVDISEEAVEHARRKYGARVRFEVGSVTAIPLEDASVDVVISFETLEHISDHQGMMREIKRVLRPGGTAIISTPDKIYYSIIPKQYNEYHLKELSKVQFEGLISQYFARYLMFEQDIFSGSVVAPCEGIGAVGLRDYLGDYDRLAQTDGVTGAPYLIAVATDAGDHVAEPLVSLFRGWDVPTETEKQLTEARDAYAASLWDGKNALEREQLERRREVEALTIEMEGQKGAIQADLDTARIQVMRMNEDEARRGAEQQSEIDDLKRRLAAAEARAAKAETQLAAAASKPMQSRGAGTSAKAPAAKAPAAETPAAKTPAAKGTGKAVPARRPRPPASGD